MVAYLAQLHKTGQDGGINFDMIYPTVIGASLFLLIGNIEPETLIAKH